MPVLTIFAGPNGSGKSSIIRYVAFVGRENLLEADAIAMQLRPDSVQVAAITAGRQVLTRTTEYLSSGRDFAIETTLSGVWTTRVIAQALTRRFFVRLVYICLETPEQCILRIHERVAQGGHSVPDKHVRRRYWRSLSNLGHVIGMVNEVIIYDNSGPESQLIAEIRSGSVVARTGQLPAWAWKSIDGLTC